MSWTIKTLSVTVIYMFREHGLVSIEGLDSVFANKQLMFVEIKQLYMCLTAIIHTSDEILQTV